MEIPKTIEVELDPDKIVLSRRGRLRLGRTRVSIRGVINGAAVPHAPGRVAILPRGRAFALFNCGHGVTGDVRERLPGLDEEVTCRVCVEGAEAIVNGGNR